MAFIISKCSDNRVVSSARLVSKLFTIVRKQHQNGCHYEVLGVSKSASKKDIREAYLKQTKQYHPDRNPNDKSLHEKFVKITQAYEILADDELKGVYDGWKHTNVVYQQRRQRYSTADPNNPFGSYNEPLRDWEWDAETKHRMEEEFYKTYAEHTKQAQKDFADRRSKNIVLLLILFAIAAGLGGLNFTRIIFYHHGYKAHMDRMSAENAAYLKDSRFGYGSFIKKVTSSKQDEKHQHRES